MLLSVTTGQCRTERVRGGAKPYSGFHELVGQYAGVKLKGAKLWRDSHVSSMELIAMQP